MLISDLIKILEECKQDFGDLEVTYSEYIEAIHVKSPMLDDQIGVQENKLNFFW